MNKQMTTQQVVAELKDGMTIGIGGWGPRRKPMALIREILRSDLKDLTIVAYGGADVGMLCAAGKVKKVVFAFVSLDFIPLEPYFRKARQTGSIETMEIDSTGISTKSFLPPISRVVSVIVSGPDMRLMEDLDGPFCFPGRSQIRGNVIGSETASVSLDSWARSGNLALPTVATDRRTSPASSNPGIARFVIRQSMPATFDSIRLRETR